MQAKVSKWGHSLAVRIPRVYAEALGITAGADVAVTVSDGALTVRPKARVRYRLDDLLRQLDGAEEPERILRNGAVGGEML